MLDPATLATLIGGLAGSRGGGTKVSQSVSNASNSGLSLSISNLIGPATAGPVSSSAPQTSNPIASATQTPDPTPSPSYGAFADTSYATSLPSDIQISTASSGMTASKALILGVLGLVGVVLFVTGRKKR